MKTCTKCEIERPLDQFYVVKRKRGTSYDSWCKGCHNVQATERYRKDPDYYRKYNLRKVGATPELYEELYNSQEGKCKICSEVTSGRLCVDHDHLSGEVRGLLCSSCNRALGYLRDNPTIADQAAKYLRKEL